MSYEKIYKFSIGPLIVLLLFVGGILIHYAPGYVEILLLLLLLVLLLLLLEMYLKIQHRIDRIVKRFGAGQSQNEKWISRSLLSPDCFAPIFNEFKGRRIGFVVMPGNVGDRLLAEAAIQMFQYFGVDFECVNSHDNPGLIHDMICRRVDELVINGGGNMGSTYQKHQEIRRALFKYGKPITVLPQTFISSEDYQYKRVWVCERRSLKIRPDAYLAPDLALGYSYRGHLPEATQDLGVWLRADKEKTNSSVIWSLGDPARRCYTPDEYIRLAAKYKKIVTNRLHFAVAGLIAGREVVLLPNNYFKNQAVWETWLQGLGCKWHDNHLD